MSYSGFGLSPASAAAMKAALPSCYNTELDRCLEEEYMNEPECARYKAVNAAYAEDEVGYRKIIDAFPYCDYSKKQLLIAGGGALAVGLLVGMLVG